MVKILICILSMLILVVGCKKEEKYPININSLTYFKKGNFDDQFKINGKYVHQEISTDRLTVCYFFRDGTFCSFGRSSKGETLFCTIPDNMRNIPYYWGAYIMDNDTVKIQKFYPYRETFGRFEVEEMWGKILNDSTLFFFKRISPDKHVTSPNTIFNFQKCLIKPDSTNILMRY